MIGVGLFGPADEPAFPARDRKRFRQQCGDQGSRNTVILTFVLVRELHSRAFCRQCAETAVIEIRLIITTSDAIDKHSRIPHRVVSVSERR